MPQTPHIERHFTAGEVVRDVVIGMSDGLTVPFALAAGLSGAVDNSHIVVVAGLAEIAAGSIAMGLGGYLAATSDAEHYESERLREEREVEEIPDEEAREVQKVFTDYGLSPDESVPVSAGADQEAEGVGRLHDALRARTGRARSQARRPERLNHRRLLRRRRHHPARALHAACTARARRCGWSVVVTLIALGVFGYIKGRFTGSRPFRSASQTVVIGGLAAGAAFLLAKLIS